MILTDYRMVCYIVQQGLAFFITDYSQTLLASEIYKRKKKNSKIITVSYAS